MRFSHFFIDRPIFASVLSIIILIVGGIAQFGLPVSEYPEIAPPTVNVTATYPAFRRGHRPDRRHAAELEINGVDDMLYINRSDRRRSVVDQRRVKPAPTRPGQVNVQNRVAVAQPRLPGTYSGRHRRAQASPDLMMVGT